MNALFHFGLCFLVCVSLLTEILADSSTMSSPTIVLVPNTHLATPSREFYIGQNVTCTYVEIGKFKCGGRLFENAEEERDEVGTREFYRDLAVCISLFIIGALSSGLMSGLMSTPLFRLQILERSGTQQEQKYAAALIAIVKNHHWLLVAMLLSITICMQALPTFFANLVGDPYLTIGITIPSILVFVQIIPQATCQRWSLQIGYFMSWFVWLLMVVTSPVSWPISKILDFTVGDNDSLFLGRKEIQEAIRLNAEAEAKDDAHPLDEEEVRIIQGAINFRDKRVRDKFVPIDKVFMIPDRAILGPELIAQIKEIGHSRIPVYHNTRDMIIGILLVFDILNLNPADRTPVDELDLLEVPRVSADLPLHRILSNFKTGGHQMAVVLDPANKITPIGIITLEDVLEVLIDSELQDEKEFKRKKKMELGNMRGHSSAALNVAHIEQAPPRGTPIAPRERVRELLNQPGSFVLRHGPHNELEIARSPLIRDEVASIHLENRSSMKRLPKLPQEHALVDVTSLRAHPAHRLSAPTDGDDSDDEPLIPRR